MSRWFRVYEEMLHDPKVQCLPAATYKAWMNLLCVASKHDGVLPDIRALTFLLQMDARRIRILLADLEARTLLDRIGDTLAPHGWATRQYRGDLSTERVKRFRNARRAVSGTAPETEAETETEKDKITLTRGRIGSAGSTRHGTSVGSVEPGRKGTAGCVRDADIGISKDLANRPTDAPGPDHPLGSLAPTSPGGAAPDDLPEPWPPDAFKRWLALYPRKTASDRAAKAFETLRRSGRVSWSRLVETTTRYAGGAADPRFIPYPANWLAAGHWNDEPSPATPHRPESAGGLSATFDRLEARIAGAGDPRPGPLCGGDQAGARRGRL
jgi:hypothetical protein